MSGQPMHTLHIATTFEDSHLETHAYDQPGHAQDAHDSLAARWKTIGATFTRDRAARSLTRAYLTRAYEISEGGQSVRYTDVVTHIAWEDR
jgi:hypothetical protein